MRPLLALTLFCACGAQDSEGLQTEGRILAFPVRPICQGLDCKPVATEMPVLTAPKTTPALPAAVRIPALECEPIEGTGYRNGRGFPITLIRIDERLVETETARAYWAMQEAAASDGVALPIYSAFRSNEDQRYFRKCFKSCSCNSCSPAARPGHSNHQSGRAIDFGQWDGVIDWLKANGKSYGFRATVPREPWHWEYKPHRRKKKRNRWPAVCPMP